MSVRFSNEAEARLQEILARYPHQEAALLPALWLAQKEFGWLSPDVRSYVAERLGLSLARVESVVSFYTLFKTEPAAEFHIEICRNLSCDLRGCEQLVNVVVEELGIQPGERTSDGQFAFSTVECMAACGGAPALQVNQQYHEQMGPEALRSLIQEMRKN